ncbi:cationic amino acid transporter 3-like isoform X1 [Panulirus ornatus]|uniref:cationic amino acid transporter 3-like isoform X1 n=1 Tax=Panulirus ornatus TaxID=150431 RepID=UPI003A8779A8
MKHEVTEHNYYCEVNLASLVKRPAHTSPVTSTLPGDTPEDHDEPCRAHAAGASTTTHCAVEPGCCGCGGRGWCCVRMGGLLCRVCEAVTRRKTVDPPAPGLQHHLTLLDLAAVGAVCAELGVRIPRGGGIFTHVYVWLGELPAVLVASTLMLDLLLMTAIAARSSSEYLSAATNHSVSAALHARLPLLQESRYLAPHPDLLAAALVLLTTFMVVAGTKLVCQVGIASTGVSLLVLTATVSAASFTADTTHWTHPPGFLPYGLHGVVAGAAVLSVAVGGAHHAGLLAGECSRYRSVAARVGVGVGVAALLVLFPAAIAATLASSSLTSAAPLTQLFPGASLVGMRALVGVGGVLGLVAAMVGGLVGGSRLAHRLACDGLAPRCLAQVSRHTATPWVAALLCGTAATLTAAVCSSWVLVRTAGAGGVSAGVAGAAAVLARRYRPQTTHHPLESAPCDTPPALSRSASTLADITPASLDDTEPYQVAVEWTGGRWVSAIFDPPMPPTWASWRTSRFLMVTFTVNCLAGVGVVRGARELDIGMWAWAGVALCVCGCLVCGVGLWLQPRHPPPTATQQEAAPLLPLLAILTNILLLLHLPPTALTAACGVWAAAAAVWLLQGRTASMEAVLSRALLTHSGHQSPADLL